MRVYVMDAFSDHIFGGNQAGVVLADRTLEPKVMQQVAAELKHSETVFVHQEAEGIRLRYFTPAGEVDLCGHATVSAFALLRKLGKIGDGAHKAHTPAGELEIEVSGGATSIQPLPPLTSIASSSAGVCALWPPPPLLPCSPMQATAVPVAWTPLPTTPARVRTIS